MSPVFPAQVFRAYDIRGNVSFLTPEFIEAVANGLAQLFVEYKQLEIVLGYDARLNSEFYADIIQTVCVEKGIVVHRIGQCSSPLMYFSARFYGGNGIMVTASHNDKTDNGVKWILQGLPPSPDMIQVVAENSRGFFLNKSGLQFQKFKSSSKFSQQYIRHIQTDIHLKRTFKVVVDGLNGSAGQFAVDALQILGCEVVTLRCKADGNFPDHAPDPSKEQHLGKLKSAVLEHRADVGFALDGDGDRLVLVDENAQLICADQLLCLFSEICLKTHPTHEIVFDVKCSTMVRNTIRKLGGIAKMIRTGSTFLRTYLAHSQGQAVFGGEYAGHYVFNDGRGLGYDDGLYACTRILEYLSESPFKTVSALFSAYPDRASTEDLYIPTAGFKPSEVLAEIEQASQKLSAELSKIDGIRLDFDDGFGIIRASNTGEYFTVRFDADNSTRLDDIRDTFVTMLRDKYPTIAQDILDAQ